MNLLHFLLASVCVALVVPSPYVIASPHICNSSLELENSISTTSVTSSVNQSFIENVVEMKAEALYLPRKPSPTEIIPPMPVENDDGVTKVRIGTALDHVRGEVTDIYFKLQAELVQARKNHSVYGEIRKMEQLIDRLTDIMLASRPRFG